MVKGVADIDIKELYLSFINKATKDFIRYKKDYERVVAARKTYYEELVPRKEDIAMKLYIDLDVYSEFKDGEYDIQESLYNRAKILYNDSKHDNDKDLIRLIIKWCNIIKRERELLELSYIADKKRNMKLREYQGYVANYFNHVHKHMLLGEGYKFSKGLGIAYIVRYTTKADAVGFDYKATKERKRELIAKGVKLYNAEEARIAKENGQEYDAEDYRIFKHRPAGYRIKFTKSKYWNANDYTFRPTTYHNAKYRNITYKDIVDKFCNTVEDIANLQVDLRAKISMFLMKYPERYINFDRKVM